MNNKDELREIVKNAVEDVWYNRRSLNPVEDQTNQLTDSIWSKLYNDDKDENKVNTSITDAYIGDKGIIDRWDVLNWAYYLGLKLDGVVPLKGFNNFQRIEIAIKKFLNK